MKINTATEVTEKVVKVENQVVNIQLTPREAFLLTAFIGSSRNFCAVIKEFIEYGTANYSSGFKTKEQEDKDFFYNLFCKLDGEVNKLPNVN